MNARQQLVEKVGSNTRLRVINELKRTPDGLPVRELASRLGMSYMGVKEVCLDLEKRRVLDTWRQPGKMGRPQMLYRLTERAHELFPTVRNALTLDVLFAAQKLFGPSAAEKLLLVAFQKKTAEYAARVNGENVAERAAALARLRDAEGCMCEYRIVERGEIQLIEHQSPILDVLQAFPIVEKLEIQMFEHLLRGPVRRADSRVSGAYCVTYTLAESGLQNGS